MGIEPFKHLQLSDLSKWDAVVAIAIRTGVVYPESSVVDDYPNNKRVIENLRNANLTAISIMANIFY